MTFSLAFSPCPNDTFIFDALVNKKIDTNGFNFNVVLEDVQTLNQQALKGMHQFTKISYGVLPLITNHYKLLTSGGALGKGVGPLLISKNNTSINSNTLVAIPGENTTAHLLFSLAYPNHQQKIFMPFHEIENWLLNNTHHAGVIIHENRFTYQQKGLQLITDLGAEWENKLHIPIPLGGIVVHQSIDKKIATQVNQLIKNSIDFAWKHYPNLSSFVQQHAQEMSINVMKQHIDLYVNEFSKDLNVDGKDAVLKLLEVYALQNNITTTNTIDLFVD
jgi:1,4-dihydroxy-6-naphthoate synthase